MNIFILDNDIEKCARYHCDQHINKMIVESAQMLCTTLNLQGCNTPYKSTHINHPCTKWVRESYENYWWLYTLVFFLNEEAKRRYNHCKNHLSYIKLQGLPEPDLPKIGITKFARAMPDEFKAITDTVEAYREYYKTKIFATWKNNDKPYWYG